MTIWDVFQDIYFVGLVGNHGDNNPTVAREMTNKRFGEKHSKASQTLSNLHLRIMNELETLYFL